MTLSLSAPVRGATAPAMGIPAMSEVSVVHSTLRSAVHSPSNRHRARSLVWDWVASRWSRLVPASAEREQMRFERALPGQRLRVTGSPDGSLWTLALAHSDREGRRGWMTKAWVTDAGDADVVGLHISCTELPDVPLVVAPPRLLGSWVEHLDMQDAGLAVQPLPREVTDERQLDGFWEHVLSEARTLPVIALSNKPQSRFYGVDPGGLAQAVCGLAHVACIDASMAAGIRERLGERLGVVAGAARIYAPGIGRDASANQRSLIRNHTHGVEPVDTGAFRRLLRRRICAMSVEFAHSLQPSPPAAC